MSWIFRDYPVEYLGAFRAAASPGPPGECWLWPEGHRATAGYGLFSVGGVQATAHRLSYAVHHGDPGTLLVRHTCDRPPCWNPEHLLIGTDLDNRRDSAERDRTNFGERNPHAKLTTDAVREIFVRYHRGDLLGDVAVDYGIGPSVVCAIGKRRSWRRATADLPDGSLTRTDRALRGDHHPMAKLSQSDVAAIRGLLADGVPRRRIADEYRIGLTTVGRIKDGVRT